MSIVCVTLVYLSIPQYLGDMDAEGRPSVHEDQATPLLPLLYIPGRVLFPGETLPMHIYNPHVRGHVTIMQQSCDAGHDIM